MMYPISPICVFMSDEGAVDVEGFEEVIDLIHVYKFIIKLDFLV